MKVQSLSVARFVFFILLAFVLFYFHREPSTEMLNGSEECKRCHIEVYREAVVKPYRHSVVGEKCAICHIERQTVKEEMVISSSAY